MKELPLLRGPTKSLRNVSIEIISTLVGRGPSNWSAAVTGSGGVSVSVSVSVPVSTVSVPLSAPVS